jgi:hypothetical protein
MTVWSNDRAELALGIRARAGLIHEAAPMERKSHEAV